ncbi:hypothetical protein LTR17_005919 [Elasticomyces elasticus]|nr:hypothetical protein LTR17_005919 [Elasticomyces elasticus]
MAETVTMSVTEMREQIKVNALSLYPEQASQYLLEQQGTGTTGYVSPSGAFDVVITMTTPYDDKLYQAYLTYNRGTMAAAKGELVETAVQAWLSLLEVTAQALAGRMDEYLSSSMRECSYEQYGDGLCLMGFQLMIERSERAGR